MKTDRIVAAEVLVTSPGRNYVAVKITTADGLNGWGDATLNGRDLAVAAYLRDHVCPLLIGATRPASKTPGSTSTAARTGGAGR